MARGHSNEVVHLSFLGVAGEGIDLVILEEGLNSKVNFSIFVVLVMLGQDLNYAWTQ